VKKEIPLVILENLQPFVDKYHEIIHVVPDTNSLFKIIDKDPLSNCFFKVVRQEVSNQNHGYIIEHKPTNNSNPSVHKQWTRIEDLVKHAENWKNLIVGYNGLKTIYDDPILKQYEEEFNKDFKIVDDDSKTNRFNFSQQVLLLNYIENVKVYISEEAKDILTEDKEYLLSEAESLSKSISTETKEAYVKKQNNFWAKIRKKSIKACDFAIKEFVKEVIKEMAKKGISAAWEVLPYYIEYAKSLLP
jgi:hypothetical protein